MQECPWPAAVPPPRPLAPPWASSARPGNRCQPNHPDCAPLQPPGLSAVSLVADNQIESHSYAPVASTPGSLIHGAQLDFRIFSDAESFIPSYVSEDCSSFPLWDGTGLFQNVSHDLISENAANRLSDDQFQPVMHHHPPACLYPAQGVLAAPIGLLKHIIA